MIYDTGLLDIMCLYDFIIISSNLDFVDGISFITQHFCHEIIKCNLNGNLNLKILYRQLL